MNEPHTHSNRSSVQNHGLSLFLTLLAVGIIVSLQHYASFEVRVAAVLACALLGGIAWLLRHPAGAGLCSAAVAAGWISLASYPAGVSLLPRSLIVIVLCAALVLPWTIRAPKKTRGRLAYLFPIVLGLWMLYTPPARRYTARSNHPELLNLAAKLTGPEDAIRFVHENIERVKGPPTDTALDTLRRGQAHCGGMSGLLHNLLENMGHRSQIIHLRSGKRGHIHTLIEVRVEGVSYIGDPQENFWVRMDAEDFARGEIPEDAPTLWQGNWTVYRYTPGPGYVEVARP